MDASAVAEAACCFCPALEQLELISVRLTQDNVPLDSVCVCAYMCLAGFGIFPPSLEEGQLAGF